MNRANNSVSSFELSVGRDVYDTPRNHKARIPLTMPEKKARPLLFNGLLLQNQNTKVNR